MVFQVDYIFFLLIVSETLCFKMLPYKTIKFMKIIVKLQWQQHPRRDRHDILRGVLLVRCGAQRGAAPGRHQRARHRHQQARVRAPLRRAPVHPRRREAVALAAERSHWYHTTAASPSAITEGPAAAAVRPRRPRPHGLAPTHTPQARHTRRTHSPLVLGDRRRVRRGHARPTTTIRDGFKTSPTRWVPRTTRLDRSGRPATVHAPPRSGRFTGLPPEGTHMLQPARLTTVSEQRETARQAETGGPRNGRFRRWMIDNTFVMISLFLFGITNHSTRYIFLYKVWKSVQYMIKVQCFLEPEILHTELYRSSEKVVIMFVNIPR